MFPTKYQEFIHLSRYARWLEDKKRRETFTETVDRYLDYLVKDISSFDMRNIGSAIDDIREAILNLEIMPSMRALMTAGPALERDNTCAYNCSYLPVDSVASFSETLFILMCGTGVGYSVERKYTEKLPVIPSLHDSDIRIYVEDSKEGWADALYDLITHLYHGSIPTWDLSALRPAGARLKTFGGRSSGPEPLNQLLKFVVDTFVNAQGRKLKPIECHDIQCKIGQVVVVGGVRRSAMIALFDRDDEEMKSAKKGEWWKDHEYRALANNSAVYEKTPSVDEFLEDWLALYTSHSGEPGIFNREAAKNKANSVGRSVDEFGTNPCSEIILRPYQFCNLTEVIAREDDTEESLLRKVELATILGTLQSRWTNFPYLRSIWRKQTEEERLLGVSLTGIYDCPLLTRDNVNLKSLLVEMRSVAKQTNEELAHFLNIPVSASVTCVKPSGTVSQLVDSASGIHPRYSRYYIRTVRIDKKDPIGKLLKDQGVPCEDDVMHNDVYVFSFPMRSPDSSVLRNDLTALSQLNLWLTYAEFWCEHKPSITVQVKDDEWIDVAAFVYRNFDKISGIAFLPFDSGTYKQAPYQEITSEEYEDAIAKMPEIDFSELHTYEKTDHTVGIQSLACSADSCEIVDLVKD